MDFDARLAPYAAHSSKSRGRRHIEPPAGSRSEFQRDRDRIIPVSYTHLTLPTKRIV